jgi:hypothetical protein
MSTHLGASFYYVFNPHIKQKNQVRKVPLFFLDLKSKPNIHKFLWSPFWYLNWVFWCQYLTNVFKNSISKFIPLGNLEMDKKLTLTSFKCFFLNLSLLGSKYTLDMDYWNGLSIAHYVHPSVLSLLNDGVWP